MNPEHPAHGEVYGAAHFSLASPGDRQTQRWILKFDDADRRDMYFKDADEAWAAWNRFAPSYNCYLFTLASLATPPATDVALRDMLEPFTEQPSEEQQAIDAIVRDVSEGFRAEVSRIMSADSSTTDRDDALAVLTKWHDNTPLYEGNDPRAVYYRRNRKALEAAINALAPTPPDEPQIGDDHDKVRCETHGHVFGHTDCCVFCNSPKPKPFSPELIAEATHQVNRLAENLDITNADYIALWLEANKLIRPDDISWLACRIVEAHEAAIAAMLKGGAGETGWLIEHGASEPCNPRYWGGVHGWTYEHLKAVRFAREVDAQSIAESMDDGVPGNYRLAEHRWG